MKVIVTGALGFIGSHLVDRLVEAGHEVYGIDDLSGGFKENMGDAQEYHLYDCRDADKMDKIFSEVRPDVVYHLAANAAENKAQFCPIDVTSRNYSAFINILTPFIKYGGKRFVYTSSIAVYGHGQTPFKETDKPEPEDLYGITKLAAERTLEIMAKVHEFEYVIARPHNVYGPRQNMSDPYRNVVTIWMNNMLKKQSTPIYGDGEQVRCFSYIDDVIAPLYKCGFKDVSGKIFNIGSDKGYSLNELAGLLGGKREYFPERPQEVKVAVSDHSLCRELLGYNETPLAEGIKNTWEWCRSKGYQKPVYTEFEIDSDKIPTNWRR